MADRFASLPATRAWGVAALVREVAESLAGRFAVCTVRGELSGFSRAGSGHCYFNLKDAEGGIALLRCAMFRRAATLLSSLPSDGQLVEVRGRLGLYEQRGELQLVVESMQNVGAGALYEQFLRLRVRLDALGLFDAARKRRVPAHPRAVGVVTSLGAAALHDVLTALARRTPHIPVIVYPSAVQGGGAAAALAEAITLASRRGDVDALIVCRGGGSLEDLWAFNDERVVRAIAAASMPVVSGVGHETDVTLADLAADLRAATPTAAAELIATALNVATDVLDAFAESMRRRVHDRLDAHAQRLDRAAQRLARPAQLIGPQSQRLALLAHRLAGHAPRLLKDERQRLDRCESEWRRAAARQLAGQALRLGAASARLRALAGFAPRAMLAERQRLTRREEALRRLAAARLSGHREHLDALTARLNALDPRRVLARGYAWLSDASGRPLLSVRRLEVGADLLAVLQDGDAEMRVTAVRGRTDL